MKLLKCLLSLMIVVQAISQTPPEKAAYLKQAAISENAGTMQIIANSPRPLAQTLDALQAKYGWVVDYEDPQFLSKLDLTATGPVSQTIPAGGRFTAEFPATLSDEEKVLQIIVDSYNHSDNPGRFELRKSKQGIFSVVGTEARDTQGKLSPQQAVFDAPITLATRQRTVFETLNLIFRKIALQRHVTVTVGVSPRNLLDHTNVTVGGAKVRARDLVLQALTSSQRNFYWRLFFDPKSKGYFLDIHLVRTP